MIEFWIVLNFSCVFQTFSFITQASQTTLHNYNPAIESGSDFEAVLKVYVNREQNAVILAVSIVFNNTSRLRYYFATK